MVDLNIKTVGVDRVKQLRMSKEKKKKTKQAKTLLDMIQRRPSLKCAFNPHPFFQNRFHVISDYDGLNFTSIRSLLFFPLRI
jgi:hypothetical protein